MSRYTNTVPQIIDKNGIPIVGAKKFFFEPNSTTFRPVYTDSNLTIPADNPQLSDATGRYSNDIFLDGIYKEEQQDNTGTATGYDGVTLWTKDPVGEIVAGQFELWVNSTTYNIPDIVKGSDDQYYISLVDANQGNDPTISPSEWEVVQLGQNGTFNISIINDTNGNPSVVITPTISAVNHLDITNAAAGNKPAITQIGADDVGLDIEGVELKNGDILAAIARLTGVTADTVSATTGNADLKLISNGTGTVTVDNVPITSIVTLDTPEEILSDDGTVATWTTISSTTLDAANAKTAILRIALSGTNNKAIHLRKTGSALSANRLTEVSNSVSSTGQAMVNLNGSGEFDWYNNFAGTSGAVSIVLIGYHI